MLHALIDGFRRYADFRGRTSRSGFWNFIVATHLLVLLCMLPALVEFLRFYRFILQDERLLEWVMSNMQPEASLATQLPDPTVPVTVVSELSEEYLVLHGPFYLELMFMVLGAVLAVVCLLPSLAVTVRRLRDAGQSVWWVLPPVVCLLPVPVLPCIAAVLCLVTLVLCCLPGRAPLPPLPGNN